MIITKKALPRRTVVRSLGVTLALPWLESMAPALTALSQSPAAPPRRLGVFYVPNRMSLGYWSPHAEALMGWTRAEAVGKVKAHESADHVDVSVSEGNQLQYPVDHRVTERNQRVDCAQRDTVDQLLDERTHIRDSLSSTVGVRRSFLARTRNAITGLQIWPRLPALCFRRSRRLPP